MVESLGMDWINLGEFNLFSPITRGDASSNYTNSHKYNIECDDFEIKQVCIFDSNNLKHKSNNMDY